VRATLVLTPGVGPRQRLTGIALGLVVLALAASAVGQGADPRAEMTRTVLDQLAALRRDDWAAAYAYAASTIQARFGPEAFRQMVTSGYAEIAQSVRATVSHVEMIDADHGLVQVRVDGANGQTVDALYELIDEQGSWRIQGVLTRPVDGTTASLAGGTARLSPTAG
jgi:Domain of unknown function (DUF4864)